MGWILRTCMHNSKFCVVENLVEMPNLFLPWIAFYLPFPSPAKGLLQKLKTIQTVFLSMYNKASWMVFLLGVSSKEGGGEGFWNIYLLVAANIEQQIN